MQDINDLVGPEFGWYLGAPTAINDRGQIVGMGAIGGEEHAFLLSPVPEPTSLAIWGLGLAGTMLYTQRRRKRAAA